MVANSTAIYCLAEDETIDHVLVAEAVQLQVHNIFEGGCDDCMFVKGAVSFLVNSIGVDPAVNHQLAGPQCD